MLKQLVPFAFLGIFQVIGGLVAGDGLHKLVVDRALRSSFLIIWGMFFGGIPAVIGIAMAAGTRPALLALLGPLLFVGALLFGMLLLPWLAQELGAGTLGALGVGCLFMLLGGGTVAGIVRAGTGATFIGLIVGAIFGVVGLWLCWTAISPLIYGTSLDSREMPARP
jgi:hypothetical protein